jgi:hypothetical protein
MTAAKPEIMQRHMALLEQRYDLSNRPAQGVKMASSLFGVGASRATG